jgi:exopolysaccharide biosynthesis polyprenyl glycosylphosphotransferase
MEALTAAERPHTRLRGLSRVLKRGFDVVGASLLLLLLSPLMLLIAVLVKASSRGPVFYTQKRVGEGGTEFDFIKFRSMRTDADDGSHKAYALEWIRENKAAAEDGGEKLYKIKDDPRITPIGRFIRRFSIDELPQLVNVLRGDMSLVGPRPPIPYEVEAYRDWHRRRLDGPQGITGLWQVSGRNRLSFDEMVRLDIEYLERWSLALDLKILLRTVGVVLFDRAH